MNTKQELEQLEVPAVLLEDGRIITGETLQEVHIEEYNDIIEAIKKGVAARHLIPECVLSDELDVYLEFDAEIVAKDNFWLEDAKLLHKIVFDFVVNWSSWGVPEVRDFDESFSGIWEDFKTFAYDIADNLELREQTPEALENYIDWEAWISDLKLGFTELALPNGHVAIFQDHH